MSVKKMHKNSLPSKSIIEDSYPRKCSVYFPKSNQQISLKILSSKKLEKYEKEAINYFYANQHAQCFECLDKCLNLLRKQPMLDHEIYVYYLYVEFLVKLKEFKTADSYLLKAKELLGRLNMNERQRNHEYIVSIQTLQICLQSEKNNHQRVLNLIQIFSNKQKQFISDKIYKQIKASEIIAYIGLNKSQYALKCIEELLPKLDSDVDKIRFNTLKIKCLFHNNPSEMSRYLKLLQQILAQTDKIQQKKQRKLAKFKVYQTIHQITDKNPIYSIYYLQQFIKQDFDQNSLLLGQRRLFQKYYQIGDFDKCIEIFNHIKSIDMDMKIINSGDMMKYAQILEFYEDKEDAFDIYSKALQIQTNDIQKLRISLKLLKYNPEQTLTKDLLKKIQKRLKSEYQNIKSQTAHLEQLREQFVTYLKIVGKTDKVNKLLKKQLQKKQYLALKQRDCNSLNCTISKEIHK